MEAAAQLGPDALERRDNPRGEDKFVYRGLVFHPDSLSDEHGPAKQSSAGAGYAGSQGCPSASMTRVS